MKLRCGTSCHACPKCWRLKLVTLSSHLVTGRPRIRFGTYSQLGSSISHGCQNAARLGQDVVGNVFKRATNFHCVSANRTLQNFIPHWLSAFSTFKIIRRIITFHDSSGIRTHPTIFRSIFLWITFNCSIHDACNGNTINPKTTHSPPWRSSSATEDVSQFRVGRYLRLWPWDDPAF